MNGMPAAVLSVLVQTRGIKQTNAQLMGTNTTAKKAASSLDMFTGAAGRMGRQLVTAAKYGFAATAAAIGVAVAKAVEFDREMRNVNSIAQLSERRFGNLQEKVLALAGPTAQAPKTLAAGLYDLVSSGFDADESLQILAKSARAATAGLTTAEVSTAAVAAVLNAYHLAAGKAGDTSDVLFEIVNRGVISFESLAQNVGDVLPFAASLDVNLREVGASIATMTKAGISAPETMTRIKAVMVSLLKPSEDLSKAIKAQGYESGEAMIKALGFQGTLDALAKATGGSKEELGKVFPNIRALGGALALTGENSRVAAADLRGMQDAAGATGKALAEQEKSISFQWNRLKATAESLAIGFGQKLLPAIGDVIDIVTDPKLTAEEKFSKVFDILSDGTRKALETATDLATAYGPKLISALATGMVGAWTDANPLGKLFMAGALIRVLGGKGAITAAGASVGQLLGIGVKTSAVAEIAAGGGVLAASAGVGAATLPAAAGAAGTVWRPGGLALGDGAARQAAATSTSRALLTDAFGGATLATMGAGLEKAAKPGLLSRLGTKLGGGLGTAAGAVAGSGIVSKLKALRWGRIGGLGIGLTLADNVMTEFGRQAELRSGDVMKELGAQIRGKELGISGTPLKVNLHDSDGSLFDPYGLLSDSKATTAAKNLTAQYEEMASKRVKLSQATIDGLRAQAQEVDLTKEARSQLDQMFRLSQLGRKLGVKVDLGMDPKQLGLLANGFDTLKSGALTSMRDIERVVGLNMGRISSQLGSKSKEGRDAMADNFRAGVVAIGKAMANGDITVKQGLARQKALFRQANLISGDDPLGIARGFERSWKKAGAISDQQRQNAIRDLGKMAAPARQKAYAAMVNYGQGLVAGGKIPKQDLRDFKSAALAQFGELKSKGTQSSADLAIGIARNFGSMGGAVANVLEILRDNTNNSLGAFGAKPLTYAIKAVGAFLGVGGDEQKKATGGFIVPGTGSGDTFRTALPPGSFIENREAVRALPFATGGVTPVALEPGERVYLPPEVRRHGQRNLEMRNRSVPRFQEGGMHGKPELAGPAGPLLSMGQGAIDQAWKAQQAYIAEHKPKGGAGYSGPAFGPAGTSTYMGVLMATWVRQALEYAAAHGSGNPQPTSGYRSHAENVAAGRTYFSEHEKTQYPGGAVDFGSYTTGLAPKMAVVNATRGFKYPLLAPIGFRDDGHASGTGHQLGGVIQALADGGSVGAKFQKRAHEIWAAASPFFGHAGEAMPRTWGAGALPGGRSHTSEFTDDGTRAVYLGRRAARGVLDESPRAEETLIHEWAHMFQPELNKRMKDGHSWEVEGGAEAFARWAAPRIYKAAGRYYGSPGPIGYPGRTAKVIKEKGWDWIKHGQFMQDGGLISALSTGGPVPPASGELVGASYYGGPTDHVSGTVGAAGVSLPGKMSFAELAMGKALGGLPFHSKLKVGYNGKSVIAEKLDIGLGGDSVGGHNRAIDLWYETANAIGMPGTGVVKVTPVSGKLTDDHTYKEDVPSVFNGLQTDLHVPSSVPGNLPGVARELRRWEDELGQYRHAVGAAKKKDRPAIVQALQHNVTDIQRRLRELRHERKKLKVGVAKRRFSGRLARKMAGITGYEKLIEQAQSAYDRRSQYAEQVVALEPLQGQISAKASEQQRQQAEEAYVRQLTGYVEGRERPAYQAVLGAAGDWRNTILGAEHETTRQEVGWESQLRARRVGIASINRYTEEVGEHLKAWRKEHKKGEKMPERLRSELETRDSLRGRLPKLRFEEQELGKVLGEARGEFFPGSQWITPGKAFQAPGQPAVPGTGAPINPPKPPLPGTGTFEDALREVQGSHWPGGHEILASIGADREAGRFGGAIWETQSALAELGLKIGDAAAGVQPAEGTGVGKDNSELLAVTQELLRQANQRIAAGEAQGAAMVGWNQMRQGLNASGSAFAGLFATGGVIPPGMWGIAGETGLPEIVQGGMHGARVLSPSDSAPVLGAPTDDGRGGELEVNVNIRGDVVPAAGVDPDEVVEVLVNNPRAAAAVRKTVLGGRGAGRPTPGDRSYR